MTIEKEHADMVRLLVKSPDILHAQSSAFVWGILHPIIGIAGEVPELIHATDKENLLEEAGDLFFYIRDLRIKAGLEEFDAIEPVQPLDLLAGRLLDLGKKIAMYGQLLCTDRKGLMLELVDGIEWHILGMLDEAGFSYTEALQHNINKLLKGPNARYAGGYSDEAAAARVDKIGTDEEETKSPTPEDVGALDWVPLEITTDAPCLCLDVFGRNPGKERAQILVYNANADDPTIYVGLSADMKKVEAVENSGSHIRWAMDAWRSNRDEEAADDFRPLTTPPRELSPGQIWLVKLAGEEPDRTLIRLCSSDGYQMFGDSTRFSIDSVAVWYMQIDP